MRVRARPDLSLCARLFMNGGNLNVPTSPERALHALARCCGVQTVWTRLGDDLSGIASTYCCVLSAIYTTSTSFNGVPMHRWVHLSARLLAGASADQLCPAPTGPTMRDNDHYKLGPACAYKEPSSAGSDTLRT